MCFDHSGTVLSDGKFEDKLLSQEIKEIKYAIDFLEKNYPFKRLILIGHSTGAINAALYAHKDKRISKVVLSGGVAKLDESVHYDFSDKQVKEFWTKGYCKFTYPDHWTLGKKLKKAYYDEFFKLNIPNALKKFKKPILIIHGEKDQTCRPWKDPIELFEIANKPKKMVIISKADHRLTVPGTHKKWVNHVTKFIN